MSRAAALQDLLRDARLWRGDGAAAVSAEATGHPALDAVLPGGGWPRGAVSEILHAQPGMGELGLAVPLLVRLTQAHRPVAFIAPRCVPYAPALAARGVALAQVLVVETRQAVDALWAAEQLLHARAGAILLWAEPDATALRRLQLAAEQGGACALLFRGPAAARESSVASLRLQLSRGLRGPRAPVQVQVLKCRGARPPLQYAVSA
ncbi:translesion DNA synthesis-associated protein ImuA [Arenimonas sp.]|uniref:translesion DNA synthesis-associated protein ImuA n=1 Tax=Arenimonas sp. TaxID=1872635 RepID=UPI002E359C7D|nr:translesion DNA synthesis-associated protein ImuA [Arenimonas sp.]HEX4855162.1 translesion DNA synthesis-associated protein ImuA [Arenimonas sp.]